MTIKCVSESHKKISVECPIYIFSTVVVGWWAEFSLGRMIKFFLHSKRNDRRCDWAFFTVIYHVLLRFACVGMLAWSTKRDVNTPFHLIRICYRLSTFVPSTSTIGRKEGSPFSPYSSFVASVAAKIVIILKNGVFFKLDCGLFHLQGSNNSHYSKERSILQTWLRTIPPPISLNRMSLFNVLEPGTVFFVYFY